MWIAAHPDDEVVIAPLLAKWCLDDRARCAILLLTRGEAGACLRPDGCAPDLISVRSSEAGAASQYFGATSILLTLPDGGGSVAPHWGELAADEPSVVTAVAGYIQAFQPAAILTFDPRHGTTCHPDHMETARVVLEAVKQLQYSPALYLLETRVTISPGSFGVQFSSAMGQAKRFDANVVLASTGQSAWNAALDDMRRHASQFDGNWITAVEDVPVKDRAVFFAPATAALAQPISPCH